MEVEGNSELALDTANATVGWEAKEHSEEQSNKEHKKRVDPSRERIIQQQKRCVEIA